MELKFYVGNQIFNKVEDYVTLDEFYSKSKIWISSDKSEWNHITLMAYFICKYEKNYSIKYRMARWSGNPAKSKESKDMSKLLKMFSEESHVWGESADSKKIAILKCYNYINWAFDKKFRYKTKINSTGLLLNHTIINEYEKIYYQKMQEHRSKSGISSLREWISQVLPSSLDDYDFSDKNDLRIFCEFYKNNKFGDEDSETKIFNKIKDMRLV